MTNKENLIVKNLHAYVMEDDAQEGAHKKEILKGVDLEIPKGEIHVVMGPNGSGKSTLSNVLVGNPIYHVSKGSVEYRGEDLLAMEPEERVAHGVFMAFQNPVELPGVNNANFLRASLNAVRTARGEDEVDALNFLKKVRKQLKTLGMSEDMLKRGVNSGFSGGEKKRNEVLQMHLLEPSFAILDETDSGLDVDALRIVAEGVNAMRSPDFSALVITHHHKLLEYLKPERVHVMRAGEIVESGDFSLAQRIEAKGYGSFDKS